MKKIKILIIFFAIFLVFITASVLANLRAPYYRFFKGSGMLYSKGSNLTVQKEKLEILCDSPYSGKLDGVMAKIHYCRIKAVYFFDSEKTKIYNFSFVLPVNEKISVSINTETGIKTDTKLLSQEFNGNKSWHYHDDTLYQADFQAEIKSGNNTIIIEYSQPISVHETKYGYWTASQYLSEINYELWPLKEWKLSSDFSLDLEITVEDDDSLWRSLFGTSNDLLLIGLSKDKRTLYRELKIEEKKAKLFLKTSFNNNFPDSLALLFGSKETLATVK